jgi:hypothetical protein
MIPQHFATLALVCAFDGAPITREAVNPSDYTSCGQMSLYVVSRLKGNEVAWRRVQDLVGPPREDGMHSFADLARAAKQMGMHPVGLKADRVALSRLPMPVILQTRYWQGERLPHFVTLLKCTPEGAFLLDPPYPPLFDSWADLEKNWSGHVLVFADTPEQADGLLREFSGGATLRLLLWGLPALAACALAALVAVRCLRRLKGRTAAPAAAPPASAATPPSRGVGRRRLRYALLIASAVAGLATIALSSYCFSAPARLSLKSAAFDLGELPPGEQTVRIPLRNAGDEELVIAKVETSCACAHITLPPPIQASKEAPLTVVLRVLPGPQSTVLTLHTNDPQGPRSFRVQWHSAAEPTLFPQRVADEGASTGTPYERIVKVVYPGGPSVPTPQLVRFACDCLGIEVKVGKNHAGVLRLDRRPMPQRLLNELDLHLSVQPPPRPGRLDAKCELLLRQGTSSHSLKLPVGLTFSRPSPLEASDITFARARLSDLVGQKRVVALKGLDAGKGWSVSRYPPWLSCRLMAGQKAPAALEVTVTATPPNLATDSTVWLRQRTEPAAEVSVSVRAFALEK